MGWREELDERSAKEVELAQVYARDFHHGTVGHNQLMLIAQLAVRLDGREISAADLARVAYRAYGESTGGKTYDGRDMPAFEDLPEGVLTAWRAAVEAVVQAIR